MKAFAALAVASVALADAASVIKPLILGGTEVPIATSQFVAGVRESPESSSFCGGSLIHPKWVLTAAHCVGNIGYVNVGTHYLNGTADGTVAKVVRQIVHPDYIAPTLGNDFALLELENEVPYTPVKLANPDGSDEPVNATATALGWGQTTYRGEKSPVLLQVNLNIVSREDCEFYIYVYDSMICAGGKWQEDTCQGDSGGPLIINKNGTPTLIGVVSFGQGCGFLAPGAYARVSVGRTFIDQYVSQV